MNDKALIWAAIGLITCVALGGWACQWDRECVIGLAVLGILVGTFIGGGGLTGATDLFKAIEALRTAGFSQKKEWMGQQRDIPDIGCYCVENEFLYEGPSQDHTAKACLLVLSLPSDPTKDWHCGEIPLLAPPCIKDAAANLCAGPGGFRLVQTINYCPCHTLVFTRHIPASAATMSEARFFYVRLQWSS
jgi:hypothetical protein